MQRTIDSLIKIELLYVLPFGLAPLFLTAFLPPWTTISAIMVVLVPWGLRFVRYHRFSIRTPLDLLWLVFLLGALIGLYPSVDIPLSMERLYGILAGIALYYIVVNSPNRAYLKSFILLFLFGVLLFATLGLKQVPIEAFERSRLITLIEVMRSFIPSIASYNLNPNALAGALIVPLPIAACLAILPREKRTEKTSRSEKTVGRIWDRSLLADWSFVPRLFCFSSTAIMLLLLFFTSSRSALIAVAGGLVVCLLVYEKRLVPLAPVIAILGYELVMRYVSVPQLLLNMENGVSRLHVWQSAYYMIENYAFTGVGLSSFSYVFPLYRLTPAFGYVVDVHNIFLQVYLDQGVLGLSSWLVIIGVIALATRRMVRQNGRGTFEYALGIGLSGALVAFILHGLLNASLGVTFFDPAGRIHVFTSPLPYILFALAAGSIGTTNPIKRRAEESWNPQGHIIAHSESK